MTPRILIDSREQLPYRFQNSKVACLLVGDYSLEGYEDQVSIERKTTGDIIACLTSGRGRFERELHRAEGLNYFALVLECSLSDLVQGKYRSKATPTSMVQSLLAFSVRYHRLPILFCENREYAKRVTESLLLKYAKEAEKRAEELAKLNFKELSSILYKNKPKD